MTGITGQAVALVLVSAGIHTAWNLELKRAADKLPAAALIVLCAAVAGTPLALWRWRVAGAPEPPAYLLATATSLLWLFYYEWVAHSYDRGDLSVAYPVTRGVAPVAALALGLAMGERPTLAGLTGVALIVVSVWLISRPEDRGRRPRNVGTAAFVGFVSALYSTIDKEGVRHCDPWLYEWLCLSLAAVWLTWRAVAVRGPRACAAVWRSDRWRLAAAGVGDLTSYGLVLLALTQAHVMYVVPLRATAVLLSVLAGGLALGESALRRRLGAGMVMVGGIALVAMGG